MRMTVTVAPSKSGFSDFRVIPSDTASAPSMNTHVTNACMPVEGHSTQCPAALP